MPSSKPASPKRAPGFARLLAAKRRTPLLMGVVNATPDSFYPDSRAASVAAGVERGLRLVAEGADMLDIGGQSTRPGSEPVSLEEELRRVIPVVEALASTTKSLISVDTDKAIVAREALAAGAAIINDVSSFRNDAGMLKVMTEAEGVVLMHRGGADTRTMQDKPEYDDIVTEVKEFLKERKERYVRAGGVASRVLIDPGIGFGKNLEHNLTLLRRLSELSKIAPVVLGVSRKSFIGKIVESAVAPEHRLSGSIATACWAALQGVAMVRVHDVKETKQALDVFMAIAS